MHTLAKTSVLMRLIYGVTFFCVITPASIAAAPFDFGFKAGFEEYLWEEFASDGGKYLDETGTRYVVSGFLGNTLRVKQDFIYRAEARLYFGTVDYDGQTQDGVPAQSDTHYGGLMLEGEAGYRAGTGGNFAWDIIGRAGFDSWTREIDDTIDVTGRAVGGGREQYTILNLRAGTGPYWQAGIWQARLIGGFKLPFFTNEYISKKDTGYSDDLNLEPKGQISAFFNFYNHFRLTKKLLLTFEAFYDSYRFDASDRVAVYDSNGAPIEVWQPESTQDTYGLQGGVSFSF